ncbi:hypothetical protein CUZ56_02105 [Saezia sanguinis]|jgi:uncharacterized protein YdcH (DUF465 family)|uniref:DUF465 domain-containing protein n=1 Tax=Saezia sanguinis TaxID=1965230 RepID=A0A433SCD0_9BURK|nr:YdcH family protein [Saezia sanguinis]RUS66379.1 hypothetical protein CUZ56_02105 [Saezia sanguinis]
MFPEYRDLISKLKNTDRYFERLFEKHNELDHKISNMEAGREVDTSVRVETLKKEKLRLKDEMLTILKKHSASA